jgi:hypothetical protein
MNRQELANEIIRLREEEKIPENTLKTEEFTYQPKFKYLSIAFKTVKLHNERWHQFTRFVLTPKKEWKYMYERLGILLNRHRGDLNDYFDLGSGITSNTMPDRMTDFIRFHDLYEEFFKIYSKIIKQIQVDYTNVNYSEQMIRGKIDWGKTILKSKGQFPSTFEMNSWQKEFSTSENILLFLSLCWLNKESSKLINTIFLDPLQLDEIQILFSVESNTYQLIQNFPHHGIIKDSQKFIKLLPSDNEIIQLIEDVESRIIQGKIRNKGYLELIEWIKKLNELSVDLLSGNPTRFHIDSLESLDTIYEAWIFLELIDFCVNEKHCDIKITFKNSENKNTFFEFKYRSHSIIVYYERKFSEIGKEAWIFKHEPDYSVFVDGELIALFDAKNYNTTNVDEAIIKMLAYLVNLDANYGALIFPKKQNQDPYVFDGKFHKNQTLTHFQMNPSIDSIEDHQTKLESMEMIFSKIISGIE